MIISDETFKDLVSAPIKRTDVVVAKQLADPYGYFDDTLVWTSSDLLMSVTIDSVGLFLGTATKKAVVKLLGIIDTTSIDDLFQIRFGLYDEDPSISGFSYISEGFFFVDSIVYDYDASSTTITMYDHMWTAQKTLYIDALDTYTFIYPTTIEGLAGQISLFMGVELMSDFSLLPNADFNILVDPYELISNSTIQSIISEIAGATGTTARISDTTLVFSRFEVSDEILDSNNLKSLKIGKQYGPVTSVILGRVPQNDNIALSSVSPVSNIISDIDTDTNLFTVVGNAMSNGSIVRLVSYGTYPEPFQPNTNYYVYTNDEPDTFALTSTYADAIAGTNIIDITSTGSGALVLSNLEIQEVQINNNQILDNDRETLLPELYAELIGTVWNDAKANTTGIGYYEVGDIIQLSQGASIFNAFISEIHLTLDGSIKENIVSTVPDSETINYQTAGGILKTIYNTEIKVDKQNQEITSIISEVDQLGDEVADNYSEVLQTIDDITSSFQNTGGSNLIQNSVGYDTDSDGVPTFWTLTGNGTATAMTSPESMNYGALSGNQINLSGVNPVLTQRVLVMSGTKYSLGLLLKKTNITGAATIRISNTVDDFTEIISAGDSYLWEQFGIVNFEPTSGYVDISIECENSSISVTDLMLLASSTKGVWQQAVGEVLNSQVILNSSGIKVKSSVYDGDYTSITPLEFAGYSSVSGSSQRTFYLNRDITHTKKFEAEDQITMSPIKIVPITTGDITGWAFVRTGE